MFIALLSALASVGNVLIDKHVLTRRKMRISDYIPLLFVFLFLATFVTLPWLGSVYVALATNQQYIFYIVLMVLLAIIWNIFYYQALQKEKIIEFEMILLMTPLVTILMAALFFPEEYNRRVFIAAVIAAVTLVVTHLRKHHFQFDRYAIHLLLAVVLVAMETMVQKELLSIYSPALLYAIRAAMLALFFTIYYQPKIGHIHDQDFRAVMLTGAMGAFYMVTKFYGYQQVGVTVTTLVLLLAPIMTAWLDSQLNNTPVKRRTIVAFVIILLCVGYAVWQQYAL
jgi:drug/metabolite transporter (DMT)-like permease